MTGIGALRLSVIVMCLALAHGASAQTGPRAQPSLRVPAPAVTQNTPPAVTQSAPRIRPLICDPLNLLPGCHVETSDGAQPVELHIWQKIVDAALPDLVYASALAASAGTAASGVRKQCWDALIAVNRTASGIGLKDANGTVLTKPDPALFTNVEQLAEVIDNLAPTGPLSTACAGAAQLAKTNTLTFINGVVTGVVGLSTLGGT